MKMAVFVRPAGEKLNCATCLKVEIDIPTMFPKVYLGSLAQSLKLISDHCAPEGKEHGMVSCTFLLSSPSETRDISRVGMCTHFCSTSFTIHG